jgi:hypothetical protein
MSDPNQEFQTPPPPVIEAEPERPRPTYLLLFGVGLVVVGIIVVVLGIVGLVIGGAATGGTFCFVGVLLAALSFIRMPVVPNPPPKMSTVATLTGIFFEPGSVFRNLRAHPRFMAAILIAGLLNGIYVAAFVNRITPEKIINFTVDKLEESPLKPPPEALANMRTEGVEQQKALTQQVGNVLKSVATHFFGVAFVAALCLLGILAFGGRMHYWQTYAVTAYVSLPFTVIQKGVSFIILYLKSPDDLHPILHQESLVYDNLGLLVSGKDHPVIFVIATTIGILSFYRLWLTAVGLREGGSKVSSTQAWGVSITLLVLFLLFGMAIAAIFPGFLS